jgi:PPOX class probable FMN-dependent enzyme
MMTATIEAPFTDLISSEGGLREVLGMPSEMVIKKQLAALDRHCRHFISLSPFMLLGTANANGDCDVSPRGDAPGFVAVLDEKRIAIPDRPGNRRIDSLRNIVRNGKVGLLFLIPGVEETLRINGRAWITQEPALLEKLAARGKVPTLAIGVEVEEAFLHCAKAFKRSKLWDNATWPERTALPTLSEMIFDQTCPTGVTVDDVERRIALSYEKNLY